MQVLEFNYGRYVPVNSLPLRCQVVHLACRQTTSTNRAGTFCTPNKPCTIGILPLAVFTILMATRGARVWTLHIDEVAACHILE